jgi:hypothetical protein
MKKAVLVLATGVSLLGPSAAHGSQLIDRDASNVRLVVASDGVALVTYKAGGVLRHVVAYGAINALAPSPTTPQVAFKLDFSGGVKSFHKRLWSGFRNACTPVPAPVVTYQVAACVAPDGSYWALQSWQRGLPNYGVAPTKAQAAFELRLSHWAGGLAALSAQTGWAYGKYDQLFGQLSYADQPVFGFRSTAAGVPLDTYGRNLYLDTLDPAYGRGWMRENSFLVHGPGGTFCYGFYPHGSRPAGTGRRYRITVIGPGVTPDVVWEGPSPGTYDAARANAQASLQRTLMGRDVSCRPHP